MNAEGPRGSATAFCRRPEHTSFLLPDRHVVVSLPARSIRSGSFFLYRFVQGLVVKGVQKGHTTKSSPGFALKRGAGIMERGEPRCLRSEY